MIFSNDLSKNITNYSPNFQNNSLSSSSTTSSQHNVICNVNFSQSNNSSPLYFQNLDCCNSPNEKSTQLKGRNFIPKSFFLINSESSNMSINTPSCVQSIDQKSSVEKPTIVNHICQYFCNNYSSQTSSNIFDNQKSSDQIIDIPFSEINQNKNNNNNEILKKTNHKAYSFPIKSDSQIKKVKNNSNTNVTMNKRNLPFDDMSIDFLIQNVLLLCGNQGGCRHLQKILEQYPNKAKDFYEQIKNNVYELSLDSFGNYFIQKLIDYLPINSLFTIFVESFVKDFLSICTSPHGTRVIQKFLDRAHMNKDLMTMFNSFFYSYINEIILDANATHIVIKYFTLLKYPQNEQLLNYLKKNILMLSINKHSCCTLQKCIEIITNPAQLYDIINSIANISHQLFNDQYGNYIIQYSLDFNIKELNYVIIQKYFSNIDYFAYQKISSNVFEKCLHYSSIQEKTSITKYLCNKETIKKLLLNKYGNYILKQAMQVSQEQEKKLFIQYISEYLISFKLQLLENDNYSKLLKKFPEIVI